MPPEVKKDGQGSTAPARASGARRSQRRGQRERPPREEREFDQKIIDLSRVTRVMAGGKRMRFRACIVLGDHKGRVGLGIGKGADVSLAIAKASAEAKRDMIRVPIWEETLPHQTDMKFGAAKILLKPAPRGTGVIAGGAVRSVLDLGGIPNVVGKMLGSRSKINNAKATILALKSLVERPPMKKRST